MLHFSSTLICGLTALRWAPAWPQQHRPRAAVRATEEELDRFFFDRAEVFTRGGPGGEGAVATKGSANLPMGAMGGDGGSVYIECCAETNALGHLHGRHVLSETVRYSGSPLAYSFSEATHLKGSWLVDLGPDGVRDTEFVEAPVPRPLARLRGTIEELLSDPALERHEATRLELIPPLRTKT